MGAVSCISVIMHFKSASDLRELERAERKRLGGHTSLAWRNDDIDDDAGTIF